MIGLNGRSWKCHEENGVLSYLGEMDHGVRADGFIFFYLNGEPRERVVPQRGLRQGDAISPYIFLLCPEALSRLISQAEALESIHGVKICAGAS